MPNPLAGHTNSYHSYGFDEALAGIADAGFKHVELSAVPGWRLRTSWRPPLRPSEICGRYPESACDTFSSVARSLARSALSCGLP